MYYIFLSVAIVAELFGTTLLKYSDRFTKPLQAVGSIVAYSISCFFLAKCLHKINLSVAYATWSAVGVLVTSLISVFILKEKLTGWGVVGLVFIVIGVALINILGSPSMTK